MSDASASGSGAEPPRAPRYLCRIMGCADLTEAVREACRPELVMSIRPSRARAATRYVYVSCPTGHANKFPCPCA